MLVNNILMVHVMDVGCFGILDVVGEGESMVKRVHCGIVCDGV